MVAQNTLTPEVANIRHLLERTPVDVEVLCDMVDQDAGFAALCREYRHIEFDLHQLRQRHKQIEEELLFRIEAFGRSANAAMNGVEHPGQAGLRAVQNDLRRLLVDMIKAGLVSTDRDAVSRWHTEAVNLHEELRTRLAAFTDEDVHLDAIWIQARHEAQSDPFVQAEENMKPILQQKCLFTLSELMAPDFNFVAAAARIRISTATG
jgi:hypothetical protein